MTVPWWSKLDAVKKAVSATIFFVTIGIAIGLYAIKSDVSANTIAIRAHNDRLEALEHQSEQNTGKLDRIICYNEESAKEYAGQTPNYARCTR